MTTQPPAFTIRTLPFGVFQTNCYLFGCTATQRAVIIDPSDNGRGILQVVQNGLWDVTHILLTHAHFDHIGALADVKAAINVPICAHRDCDLLLPWATTSAEKFGTSIPEPPPIDHYVEEGELIEVGNLRLELIFAPGHAPGHLCFYERTHGILFAGDVLFRGSIGRTDLPGGNLAQLLHNITTKLLILPDTTRVYPGHGAATTIGHERHHNPYLV